MSRAVSWSVRDDFGLREAAAEAARRSGVSFHDWLDETFRLYAAEVGVRVDALDESERAQAVARRLGRMSREDERGRGDRRPPGDYDDGFWSRAAQAVSDLDAERFGGRALRSRDAETVRRRDRDDADWREETLRRRAPAMRRVARDYDDVAEAPAYAEPARPKAGRRAPSPDQTALKRELSKFANMLAEVHETMTARGASSTEIESLRDQVADITRGIAGLAPREAIAQLDHAIQDLGQRLAEARGEGLVEQFIGPVEVLMDDLKRTLLEAAPTGALQSIDSRLGALSRSVESLSSSRLDRDALSSVLEQTADIRAVLDEAASNSRHIALIEQAVNELGERLNRIAERGQTHAGLEAVYHAIEHIRSEIARNNPAHAFSALDERLEELCRRFDETVSRTDVLQRFEQMDQRLDAMHRDLAERTPELGRLESVLGAVEASLDSRLRADVDTSRLEAIVASLGDRLDTRSETAKLRASVDDLSRQLEQAISDAAEPQVIEAMRAKIDKLVAYMDGPSRSEANAARLEQMMEALAARLDAPISRRSLEQVQETVRLLAERFEKAVREGTSEHTLARLEHRVADLSARLEERPAAFDPALIGNIVDALHERLAAPQSEADASAVARSLQDINDQIAQLREAAYTGAEIAALKAAQEALASTGAGDASAQGPALEREIAQLRDMQEAADQRTSAMLSAVHEALEKIADGLSRMKSEPEPKPAPPAAQAAPAPAAPPAPPAPPAAPATPAAARAPESLAAIEAPKLVGERPSAVDASDYRPSVQLNFGPADLDAPRVVEPAPERRPAPPVAPHTTAQRISARDESDFLLEPGAGKPSPGQSAAAREALDDHPDSLARASFIAAVRRAQQTGGPTSAGAAPDAPETERAPPAEADVDAGSSASTLRRVRRMLMVSIAVATTIFVGWQLVRPLIPNPNANSQPQKRVSAVQPTPERPAADKSSLRASEGAAEQREQALAPPPPRPVARAPDAVAPTTPDMTPVSSLPPRTVKPASPARDPVAAAAAGNAAAQFELGSRLADGRQGQRDPAKAAEWFQKAAAQNFAPAQYRLGVLYEKGTGVPRDQERARALYQSAAERGNVKAMHNLGSLLAEGVAGRPDYGNAAKWFLAAAEHGVRDSQYNIAVLSARGLGVPQDLVQSYVWFSAAAAQGDEDSAAKLKEISARLDTRQTTMARSILASFKPRSADRAANDAQEPAGGWEPPQAAPAGRSAPSATRSQRISGM